MKALWTAPKVMVLPATWVAALKVPSEAGGGTWLLVASTVTVPSELASVAPLATLSVTVGDSVALAP